MEKTLEQIMEEHEKRIEERFPVLLQPKIPTMDKKLIIEAAIPGWQPTSWYKKRGVDNLPPVTIEAQAAAIVECVKAGASSIHTHPNDPLTGVSAPVYPPSARERHAELLMAIMDRAFEQVDFITAHHTWVWDFSKRRAVDYISHTKHLLNSGKAKGVGNRYVQAALLMTLGVFREEGCIHSPKAVQEGVAWMEENGVKPMYSVQSYSFPLLKRAVFDNGLSNWKPYWIVIQAGKHTDDQIFADPWSYIQVINNISMVRDVLPDAFIGIHPAGRNWLPAAVMGIMYGCELVRVGLEDQFWLYPHKDKISQKASDTVDIIAKIARDLGREIATVDEARERLGIKLTSSK